MATFNPPVANDKPPVLADTRGPARLLFRHFGSGPRGRSVVKTAGHYVTRDVLYDGDLVGLTPGVDYFLGGHVYVVSPAVATALTADGYGAYVT